MSPKRKNVNKMDNNSSFIRNFSDEVSLYQELYDLKLISRRIEANEEYFKYCKNKKNFIILIMYDKYGRVYLKESGVNQFTFLGGEAFEFENVRDAVKRISNQLVGLTTIEELEPLVISKNIFEYNNEKIEHLGLVVMARIDFEEDAVFSKNFYTVDDSLLECIKKLSDKEILREFVKRFSNIVFYNNNEFQHEEVEVNKKYQSRYEFHNKIVKKYILTDKVKHKNELINLMSTKTEGCSRLLDVSCGDNSLLFLLHYDDNFEFIVANDISWSQIELIPSQDNVIFTNHNAITFPFKDDVFDFVYCSNTLHHIPNRENLINLLKSLIRVGKKIVIFEIEDPKCTGGFPYYLNKYWYRGFLKDAGEEYLSYDMFKQVILEVYENEAHIKFSNFKNIQGNYMIAEIEKK